MSQFSTIQENGLKPDIVDEASENITYLGYLLNGDTTKALVCKIEKAGNITSFTYPDGSHRYERNWDNRTEFNYLYRKN